jgi:hypothetical protein
LANFGWSGFTSTSGGMLSNNIVAGIATVDPITGEPMIASRCTNTNAVAGIASIGVTGTCFGPPFFVQRLTALRGIPVVLCLEGGCCLTGEIMQVCNDYLEFNDDGTLVGIPLWQITRVQLASSSLRTA